MNQSTIRMKPKTFRFSFRKLCVHAHHFWNDWRKNCIENIYTDTQLLSFSLYPAQTSEMLSMHKYVYSWMNDFHGIESINLDKYYLVVISKTLEEQFDESMMIIKGIRDNDSFFDMIAYEKPKSIFFWRNCKIEMKKKWTIQLNFQAFIIMPLVSNCLLHEKLDWIPVYTMYVKKEYSVLKSACFNNSIQKDEYSNKNRIIRIGQFQINIEYESNWYNVIDCTNAFNQFGQTIVIRAYVCMCVLNVYETFYGFSNGMWFNFVRL